MKTEEVLGSKRIAKNSLMLYMRMFLTLGIKLYSSRLILSALGIEDFGIYNAVAGVITLFTFINDSMINATQRFLTFELGKNNKKKLHDVFCTSINVHILISAVLFVLGETVGLYVLNGAMNIPDDRIFAANWVYQFTIVSAIINVMSVPYTALIIAHERMSAFAYITILEVLFQLVIAIAIGLYGAGDRLILYALLVSVCAIMVRCIYSSYCARRFDESKYRFFINRTIMRKMTSFAGWTMIGTFCYMGYTQGLNVLLNVFFGPVVNAANGIALQIQSSALGFSTNIQKAINPQITKSYAVGNIRYMMGLVFAGTKYSTFLLWLIMLPLIFDADLLLRLWLGDVPDYTRDFAILILGSSIITSGATPIITAIRATGNIRKYQVTEGVILVSIVPVTYVLLQFYKSPFVAFFVTIVIHALAQVVRCLLLKEQVAYSLRDYFCSLVVPIMLHIGISLGLSYVIVELICVEGLLHLLCVIFTTIVVNIAIASFVLINKSERKMLKQYFNIGRKNTVEIDNKCYKKVIGVDKISVIIPLYNKEKCIGKTIASVLAQTYTDFELLVVDDGSTDDSARVVRLIDDDRIMYLYKPNGGVSSARNYGVRKAKHDWIIFLDADDILYDDALESLISAVGRNPDADICCGKYHRIGDGRKQINSKFEHDGYVTKKFFWLFLNRFSLRTGCCLIRKDVLLRFPFDETLSRFEDMKAILDWCRSSTVYIIGQPLMAYINDNSHLSRVMSCPEKDFTFHLDFGKRSFFEKCVLGRVLYLGWIDYPTKRGDLKALYGHNLLYAVIAKVGLQINKIVK